tara:strand:+ start:29 stop:748 length:720 start_codon:yes stop_codon:yes gene_type:complete
MKFYINKIFDDEVDDLAHLQFIKYSRGEFKYKAMVAVKAQAKGIFKVGTTAEYGNELVRYLAEKVGDDSVMVSGVIMTTQDLDGEFDYDEKKNALGVKKYVLNREMTGNKLIELLDKFPKCFFGLSMKVGNTDLKIKPKSPKSPKPGNKADSEIKIDFCKLKTDDKELVDSLLFDVHSFKEVRVSHTLMIDEIIVSDELKKEASGDYAKIKEMAKRKGKVVRELMIDGVEKVVEKEFEA